MKKTKIVLEIETCQQCPFFEKTRYYTEDSWEQAFNWHCAKIKDKKKNHPLGKKIFKKL